MKLIKTTDKKKNQRQWKINRRVKNKDDKKVHTWNNARQKVVEQQFQGPEIKKKGGEVIWILYQRKYL